MLWLLLACAAPIPELFEPETACDGVDNNGDGRIDEGVLAARVGVQEDEAGAPLLGTFDVEATWAPGVRWVQQDGWSENYTLGRTQQLGEWTFDAQGRLTQQLSTRVSADDYSDSLQEMAYQGDVMVLWSWVIATDSGVIWDLAWRATDVEDGQVLAAEELVDGVVSDFFSYAYDAQGRELLERREDAETGSCRTRLTDYDDALRTRSTYYNVSCTLGADGEPDRFEQWDSSGRLLILREGTSQLSWSWGSDGVLERSYQFGSQSQETRFEYRDGLLVRVSDAGSEESWSLGYDTQNRFEMLGTVDHNHNTVSAAIFDYAEGEDSGVVRHVFSSNGLQPSTRASFEFDETGNLALETRTTPDGEMFEFSEWTHSCQEQ